MLALMSLHLPLLLVLLILVGWALRSVVRRLRRPRQPQPKPKRVGPAPSGWLAEARISHTRPELRDPRLDPIEGDMLELRERYYLVQAKDRPGSVTLRSSSATLHYGLATFRATFAQARVVAAHDPRSVSTRPKDIRRAHRARF